MGAAPPLPHGDTEGRTRGEGRRRRIADSFAFQLSTSTKPGSFKGESSLRQILQYMKLKETVFIFSHSKVFADFNLKLRSRFRKSSQGTAAFILIQNGAKSSKKHFLHLVLFDNKYNRFQLEWTNRILLPTLVFCCTLKSEKYKNVYLCMFCKL